MINLSNCIPLGMHLSVERKNTPQKPHPDRDASLSGCGKETFGYFLPSDTSLTGCHKLLYVFYFSSLNQMPSLRDLLL